MSEFYVRSWSGVLVPAQFLCDDNGRTISDINADAAKAIRLFGSTGSVRAEQNKAGYLIVPKGFDLSAARDFVARVRSNVTAFSYIAMKDAFVRGGAMDVQRGYKNSDGTKGDVNDPVMAFKSAASFLVGYATAAAGLLLGAAKIGGGYVNYYSINPSRDGIYYNDPKNLNSMHSWHNYYRSSSAIVDTDNGNLQHQVSPLYDFRDPPSSAPDAAGSRN